MLSIDRITSRFRSFETGEKDDAASAFGELVKHGFLKLYAGNAARMAPLVHVRARREITGVDRSHTPCVLRSGFDNPDGTESGHWLGGETKDHRHNRIGAADTDRDLG